MTLEEALNQVDSALVPATLSELQREVFRRGWNRQSYHKIARDLNHEYSYIKDVGAELWQLLSLAFDTKITKLNVQKELTQATQQTQSLSPQRSHVDWGEAIDVFQFCGRQTQLDRLEQWVTQERCRLVTIVGMGGTGKTMLVAQLAHQLAETDQFEVVVWRSLRQAPPLLDFLTELLEAISATRNFKGTAPDQSLPLRLDVIMRQLLKQLRSSRCLVILDNVEAVLSHQELAGTYRSGYENYGWLFQQLGQGRHQSSILLTSREVPTEISIQKGQTAPVQLLQLEPLSIEEGKAILAAKGLMFQAEQPHVEKLIERYRGNPLALEIVATPLKDLFDSNIAAFLAQETLLLKDIRELLKQHLDRLTLLERQVMYWLAINREAVTAAQLQADLLPSVSPSAFRDALLSLNHRSLIEKTNTLPTNLESIRYTQQPAVMEYVTEHLIDQMCQEVEQAQIVYLRSHALMKAQAKDWVRDVQMRLIVQPTIARLLETKGGGENLKQLLLKLLTLQQSQAPLQPGYFAGNVIHLLQQLGADLSHLDFSNLMIWQTDLRGMDLYGANFSHADLSNSVLTQSIT